MSRRRISILGIAIALGLLAGGAALIAFPRAIVVHPAGSWKLPEPARALGRQALNEDAVRLYGVACLPIGLVLLLVSAYPLRERR